MAHLSVKVEARNNLTPDHSHTRPADVLAQNWSRGRPAAFDICVTSLLNTLTLSEVGVCAGAAAQAGEVRKPSADDDKCGDLSWFCVPQVTETYGARGPEAKVLFSQLASRLSIRLQKPKSVILHKLYGRLNTCLVRCVPTTILSRDPVIVTFSCVYSWCNFVYCAYRINCTIIIIIILLCIPCNAVILLFE